MRLSTILATRTPLTERTRHSRIMATQAAFQSQLIGQGAHPDVALLMRHFHADHEIDCASLTGYEVEFIGEVWASLIYERDWNPTIAELIVVRAMNQKLAGCQFA